MTILSHVIIASLAFVAMEGVAWFSHKYIMHGFMWKWHKSHHEVRIGHFEKNDRFFIVFAAISLSFFLGDYIQHTISWKLSTGIGILLYGIAYFLVHDIFIHQRLPLFKNSNSRYFKAIRYAHKIHHKTHGKYGASAFGFLFPEKKYLDKYKQ